MLGTVWRDEWGRLLALLVAQYRRLDVAEDGLGDAFESATRAWPRDGVPSNPAAWLLTASGLSAIGLIHAYRLTAGGVENHFAWFTAAPDFAVAYAASAGMLWTYGMARKS